MKYLFSVLYSVIVQLFFVSTIRHNINVLFFLQNCVQFILLLLFFLLGTNSIFETSIQKQLNTSYDGKKLKTMCVSFFFIKVIASVVTAAEDTNRRRVVVQRVIFFIIIIIVIVLYHSNTGT